MSEKFSNVPHESDTKILFRKTVQISGLDALHEKWSWEGVKAESLIFVSEDVAAISDEALQLVVRASGLATEGTQMTLKRGSSGYDFVNFNFQA
ncbi:MAG: hypothetical protein ACMVY4_17475 [Minwuia sp.]|uniref:hypothetical protein n=1 Tax=Minwuia sp. TaxID=2493630 RepID=UPI003A839E2D